MKKIYVVLILLVVLLTSCSKNKEANFETGAMYEEAVATDAGIAMNSAVRSMKTSSVAGGRAESASNATASTFERKVIKTGSMSLQVKDLAQTEKQITDWATKNNGYISNSYATKNRIEITIRIPSSLFDNTMQEIETIGKVESRSVEAEDVSEQFYDLTTRLNTRKILRDNLNKYLKSAKDIKDMLEIEAQLNEVQTDIESMEGQLKRLSSQIDFSTLRVTAKLPPQTNSDGFIYPDLSENFSELWGNIVEFFANLLIVIIYIIIFGTPIVLLIALLFWLCFGKIGLIRKLFKKLRAERK